MNAKHFKLLFATLLTSSTLFAAPAKITVDTTKQGHPVSPLLWGIFFEDINLSTDGGLYPELVRNRSFEDSLTEVQFWEVAGATPTLDRQRPLNPFNRTSLKLTLAGETATATNAGYFGMSVTSGETYRLSLAARAEGGFTGPLTVKLLSSTGEVLASAEITNLTSPWKYHSLDLTLTGSDPKAKLQLSATGKGTLSLDMVSLLPSKTWGKTALRPDLAKAMADLKPSFLRFPGGCWVEGETLDRAYDWKKTIGPVDTRTPLWNIWQYNATHSIGYHEYLQMAEDLGAEPMFCINVGMSHKEVVPMEHMGQWVQDALDAIEYANGPVDSVWGSLRAKNGHPAPFNLKYLEIGNENGRKEYADRWPLFVNAIKAKYPDIQLIANHWAGGYPKSPMPTLVDEHYYNTPDWFMRHANHYDKYDRSGPKIFVGEYAVTRNTGNGNLRGAIGEAAFMTGLERNSDHVVMAAYAPLFCNVHNKRWPVNLINFDSSRWFGLPSYYVQKLFAEHRGSVTIPTTVTASSDAPPPQAGKIGVGTWSTSAEYKDVTVTAPDGKVLLSPETSGILDKWKKLGRGNWSVDNGVLRQSAADRTNVRALIGDDSWTDYTLTLKARKLTGAEGFLILFRNTSDDGHTWWNLGGWNNTGHGVELDEGNMVRTDGKIETGRWYDVKIEVAGSHMKGYLDGKLIQEADLTVAPLPTLFASATRDEKSGDLILKVVNSAQTPTETTLDLPGATLPSSVKATVLTSEKPTDENTLDEPTKVIPKEQTLPLQATHTFPPNSLTILRLSR